MERETDRSVERHTKEIPFYEVPLFVPEIERRKRRLQTVIDMIRTEQIESRRDYVYLNISSNPKRPEELRATGKTVEILQRLVHEQDVYLSHINYELPGDDVFEIDETDQASPPRWHRFFPTDL